MSSTQAPDINISITFRHTESTEALRGHAQQKVKHCVEKYISGHVDVQVVLFVEKRDHGAEVKVLSRDYDISCKAVTEDLYAAIDKVVDTLEAQIRKHKDRLRSHRHETIRDAETAE